MGFLDSLGVPNVLGGVSVSGVGRGLLIFLVVFLVAIIVGGIVFLYYSKKIKKVQYKYQIPIYIRNAGKLQRIAIEQAKELFVPDSNISLFFLRGRKIYIARPTRQMGLNEFWYYISENGEWVNFDLSINPEDDTLALANYDHRDTRYAYLNLKEIIKRNYKDKSVKWWKDPVIMNIISFVIMIFITGLALWIILTKIGNIIQDLSPIAQAMKDASESMTKSAQAMQNLNSGVVPIR